jgi:hypothetical protein
MSGSSLMKLHGSQLMVHRHNSRFKVVTAGRRWGKTWLAIVEAIAKAGSKKRAKIWYIAPSYRMAKQIFWEELKLAVPRAWVKKINETELSIKLVNGSVIECKGADKPDSLRGVGLYYVILDEFQDIKFEAWGKVIRPTLAKDRGGALIIGTPKGYENLYNVHKLGLDPKNRQWQSWQFPTNTSPFIPLEEIEAAKQDMDPKSFRQEFLASFETMSGRVYYPFDRQVHVGQYEFNPTLPIWIGSDFNIDPMSSAIMQKQPNGEVWIVDELYMYDSNTLEVCEELERRYWRFMNKANDQITIFPDPAGAYGQHARGESDMDIYTEKGFRRHKFRKKHPKIADRVNATNRMLRDATGQVRLRVNTKCENVIKSFEQTIYKPGSRDIDKGPSVEHITDAIGYCLEIEFPSRRIFIGGISI